MSQSTSTRSAVTRAPADAHAGGDAASVAGADANARGDAAAAAGRESPGGLASGFGAIVDEARTGTRLVAGGSAFDVCHVGVVLRAVLGVQLAVALGALHLAPDAAGWVSLYARASVGALWGVLVWLVLGCLLKARLAGLAVPWQWAFAVALGALCGALGALLMAASGLVELGPAAVLAQVATGAAFAAVFFYWLRLRARLQQPADSTARLAELQSRIRPHFLFNTLNTAVALVRVDPARAETVLEDLAELFRVAMAEPDTATTLGQEVELAQRYLMIEALRFGPRLRVEWDVDPACLDARVPALLLQPLVENAVRHGIEPSPTGGSIVVRGRVERGQAVLDIVNTTAADAPPRPGQGIALANVHERLRLMHDVAAQFVARPEPGRYRVRLMIPIAP